MRGLKIVQSLDPVGIGARNIQECLLLQLNTMNTKRPDIKCAITLLENHYNDLMHRQFEKVQHALKIDDDELKKAIDKCRNIIESKSVFPTDINLLIQKLSQPQPAKPVYKEKFIVSYHRKWMPVNTKDIACFMKDNIHYIFTFGGEKHILDFTTMEDIEELLDPKLFYRANRQYIVHIDAILTVQPHDNQKLTVTLKPPLKVQIDVSREKAPAFKKWFDR